MSIRTETRGRSAVLFVRGELMGDLLDSLQEAVTEQLHQDEVVDITIDMSESPFISSAALEFLLDVKDSLTEKLGVVSLVGCDENVRKILEITRLESSFHLEDAALSPAEAVNTQS
jgi:anti-anti-sigma factor